MDQEVEEKNFNISLFRALGAKIPLIKMPKQTKKEQDIYVDSFDNML